MKRPRQPRFPAMHDPVAAELEEAGLKILDLKDQRKELEERIREASTEMRELLSGHNRLAHTVDGVDFSVGMTEKLVIRGKRVRRTDPGPKGATEESAQKITGVDDPKLAKSFEEKLGDVVMDAAQEAADKTGGTITVTPKGGRSVTFTKGAAKRLRAAAKEIREKGAKA